jgi:Ca2+:H+ antiporter
VLLGKPLGKVIDYDIEGLNAPTTLGGIVIAIVVLSPEGVSSLRAAQRN